MWHAHDGMGWWMLFGSIVWLMFWATIVWLLVTALRASERRTAATEPADALEIARRRYAGGEIDRSAFEQLRQDLQSSVSTGKAPHEAHPGD